VGGEKGGVRRSREHGLRSVGGHGGRVDGRRRSGRETLEENGGKGLWVTDGPRGKWFCCASSRDRPAVP
jgi:hypothetical protein